MTYLVLNENSLFPLPRWEREYKAFRSAAIYKRIYIWKKEV